MRQAMLAVLIWVLGFAAGRVSAPEPWRPMIDAPVPVLDLHCACDCAGDVQAVFTEAAAARSTESAGYATTWADHQATQEATWGD